MHTTLILFLLWSGTTSAHSTRLSSASKNLRCWQQVGLVMWICENNEPNNKTDESGSDSDGGSSSSSFSSISELSAKELVKENDQPCQELSSIPTMSSGLDPASVYNPPKVLQVI